MLSTQKTRQDIAKRYSEELKDPSLSNTKSYRRTRTQFSQIRYKIRKQRYKKENKNALGASIHYETTLSNNSMYKNIEYRKDDCVNSSLVADTVPFHSGSAYPKEEEIAQDYKNSLKESF